VTNTVSNPSWFTFRKSVKPLNFGCPNRLQTPIKLDVYQYVTTRILFCKWLPHFLSHSNTFYSLQLPILLHTWLFLNLCPVTILLLLTHWPFVSPTKCFWPPSFGTYTYISENNFGPSNQITVTTGYNYYKLTLLGQYTILFYIIFSQLYFCSVQNIMHNLFIFHIPFDLSM